MFEHDDFRGCLYCSWFQLQRDEVANVYVLNLQAAKNTNLALTNDIYLDFQE
jgi:hypothetical protein